MRKKSLRNKSTSALIIAMAFVIFGLSLVFSVVSSFNEHEYVITITDKERVYSGSEGSTDSKYLVFGDNEDGNPLVFENVDSIFKMKFNSSNVQGSLHENKTYKLTVVGYRIPFLSMYENIIKVEEVQK